MGLDMYLRKKIYVGANYTHRGITGTIELSSQGTALPIKFDRVSEIVETVGYWRKANQIHHWFVENVQEGDDDCKEYIVHESHFKTLLDMVQRVLDSRGTMIEKEVASELPTAEGCFFGSTEIDDWYWSDLEDTKNLITSVLQEIEEDKASGAWIDYYYQSSW